MRSWVLLLWPLRLMGWLLWVVRFRVFSAADQAPDHVKNGFEQAHDLCYDVEMKEAVRTIPAQL